MMRVELDRTIEASAGAIWALISDHETRSSWYPANDEFTPTGPVDQGVGATFFLENVEGLAFAALGLG